ncbi:MAG: hypothetical protein IT349_14180 [Candidatus Eisenbacteria bacterium]|nr:hypothetical protein [Candidatus Eisenbacteria bacterium]MCC7143243.1 hypothetical protein [Candidatus Eisenbacteria bacterium]
MAVQPSPHPDEASSSTAHALACAPRPRRHGGVPCPRAASPSVVSLLCFCAILGCRRDTAIAPPTGGEQVVLDQPMFEQQVAPILDRRGCNATGDCHGGGVRGTFALSPQPTRDLAFDFAQTVLQVNGRAPEASPFLQKPLALDAGGTPHSYKPFLTQSDPDYLLLRAWVLTARFESR